MAWIPQCSRVLLVESMLGGPALSSWETSFPFVIPIQERSSQIQKPLGNGGLLSRDKEPYLLWMKAEFGLVSLYQGRDRCLVAVLESSRKGEVHIPFSL